MLNILIVFYSKHGMTEKIAEKIAQGVRTTGCNATLRTVPDIYENEIQKNHPRSRYQFVSKEDLEECSGIILGSPAYFGSIAAPLKYFIDQTIDLWLKGTLINKPVSFFTSADTMHGGHETTIFSMMLPFFHHGAIVVGIPYSEICLQNTLTGGSPYGLSHFNGIDGGNSLSKSEIVLAKSMGKRISEISLKMQS